MHSKLVEWFLYEKSIGWKKRLKELRVVFRTLSSISDKSSFVKTVDS